MTATPPSLRSVVLDTTDARASAEFYRQLLGYEYLAGFEPPPSGEPDPAGDDWVVLLHPTGLRLAFQQVAQLPRSTWPDPGVPQQLHLDLQVGSLEELAAQAERALALGARLLEDRSTDPEEQLYVFADPDGHPFCLFLPGPD